MSIVGEMKQFSEKEQKLLKDIVQVFEKSGLQARPLSITYHLVRWNGRETHDCIRICTKGRGTEWSGCSLCFPSGLKPLDEVSFELDRDRPLIPFGPIDIKVPIPERR